MPQPHAMAEPKKRNSRWANIIKSFGTIGKFRYNGLS
jgi:hypothetical protein